MLDMIFASDVASSDATFAPTRRPMILYGFACEIAFNSHAKGVVVDR